MLIQNFVVENGVAVIPFFLLQKKYIRHRRTFKESNYYGSRTMPVTR
jgi:hypothetical protein